MKYTKEQIENISIAKYKKYRILFSIADEDLTLTENYIKDKELMKVKDYRKYIKLIHLIKSSTLFKSEHLKNVGELYSNFDKATNELTIIFEIAYTSELEIDLDDNVLTVCGFKHDRPYWREIDSDYPNSAKYRIVINVDDFDNILSMLESYVNSDNAITKFDL